VFVLVPGGGDQALIATDDRLIVAKMGWMAGSMGGGRSTSFSWYDVQGIQINTGFQTASIQVQSPGYGATQSGDYWSKGEKESPFKLPNVLPTNKAGLELFAKDIEHIQKTIIETRTPKAAQPMQTTTAQPAPSGNSKLAAIRELGQLRDSGLLTEDEFAQMKRELIEGPGETPE
jgi:hypothetical protein